MWKKPSPIGGEGLTIINLAEYLAGELLEYATNNGIKKIFEQAFFYLEKHEEVPEPLASFLKMAPEREKRNVLEKFLMLAKEKADVLDVEVVSAIKLTDRQFRDLKNELNVRFNKDVQIKLSIDASLIGGLRIITPDTIIDNSIKRKLADMKAGIYKGALNRL